jgi:tripartite-type tricarboxylate transporter receptor subunit TctC
MKNPFGISIFAAVAVLLGTSALAPLAAVAQSWPQRPVKFVLPLGPGAGADIGARLFADRLAQRWGQSVVVENRPGGDGVIAINAVVGAKDDHTLFWGPTSSFVGHPYTLDKPPYEPKELVPVARVTSTVVAIAVPASLNVASLKELMTLARQQPGKLNFASAVTVTDIIFAGYFSKAGLDVQKVSYKDPVSALNDLIESRIQMYGAAYAIVRSQAQAGRIKLLAVTNRARVAGLDVPTVAEAGFPELNFDGLVGLIAARSSGLADAAKARIAADIKAIAADSVVAERLATTAQINNPGNAADFAASIEEQAAQLAATAKTLGLKPKF